MPIPIEGDRSAFDSLSYPTVHAQDIKSGSYLVHLPIPTHTSQVIPMWTGEKWEALTSGSITGVVHLGVADEIDTLVEKAVPVNGDVFLIEDSASGLVKKKVYLSSILALSGSGASGSGAVNFIELLDVPASYAGFSGCGLRVKSSLDGLEYVSLASASSIDTFIELTDTPNDYSGQGDKYVKVKTDATGLEFITLPTSGSSGSVTFLSLTDTPASYSGQAGKVPQVNIGETALEFVVMSGSSGSVIAFTDLTDVPISYVGQEGKILAVETSGSGLEFIENPSVVDKLNPISTFEYIDECLNPNGGMVDIITSGVPSVVQVSTTGYEGLHMGVLSSVSAATTGEIAGFQYVDYFRLDYFEQMFVLFNAEGYSSSYIRVGLTDYNDIGGTFGGYYLESLSTDTNYFFVEKYNDIETRVDTGIARSIGWCLFKIRRDSTGSIFFKLNDSSETEIDVPDALDSDTMSVEIYLNTEEEVEKTIYLDFISIKWIANLSRYGSTN